jgi:hypothetical protein
VVVHKNCWKCHELEKGEKASQGCSVCHQIIQKNDTGSQIDRGPSRDSLRR